MKLFQKTKLTQLQEDRIILEDIILRTMSSAEKYLYGESDTYKQWDELKTGEKKNLFELRKEFLKKLRYAISGYFDDFKKDHPNDDIEFNIFTKDELIEDLENIKKIIKEEFPQYASDCIYYDKFINLIKGQKVKNLKDEEIYKYGKTTLPTNIDENYMSNLGHEIIKVNELSRKTGQELIEKAENNGGKTKHIIKK